MNKRIIFLDKSHRRANDSFVESLAPGLLWGKGVFETMRVNQGKIQALEKHLSRLEKGLKLLKVKMPYSRPKLENYLLETLQHNRLKDSRLRLAAWQETGNTRMAIVVLPLRAITERQMKRGLSAVISDVSRPRTKYSHIKSLDYACFRQALQQATKQGFDEALLLNEKQDLVEGARSNVFFIKDGQLCTPSLECGCLDGITRAAVLDIAKKNRIRVQLVEADPRQLREADEAFLTNAVIGIAPLTRVNGNFIGQGKMGPLTLKILEVYRQTVVNK